MILTNIDTTDSKRIIDNFYSPLIHTYFKNIGKRYADSFIVRPFIFYDLEDNNDMSSSLSPQVILKIAPNQEIEHTFRPRINLDNKSNFYFCFDISYEDLYSKEKCYYSFYMVYRLERTTYKFVFCDKETETKLRLRINRFLKELKQPLFKNK